MLWHSSGTIPIKGLYTDLFYTDLCLYLKVWETMCFGTCKFVYNIYRGDLSMLNVILNRSWAEIRIWIPNLESVIKYVYIRLALQYIRCNCHNKFWEFFQHFSQNTAVFSRYTVQLPCNKQVLSSRSKLGTYPALWWVSLSSLI